MQYPDFLELAGLVDDDILLVHQVSTSALKKIKLSTLKQYVGVSSGGGVNSIKEEILKDNPLNYWQFDELTGLTAVDLGSANRNGTYTSVTLGQPSLANGSLYAAKFNNSSSIVNFNNAILNSNTDITIELVINLLSANINGLFMRLGTNYQIGLGIGGGGDTGSAGNYLIGIAGNIAWRPTYKFIGLGTHHLVMNYKGATNKDWLFYIDGFLVANLGAATIQTPDAVGSIQGFENGILTFDEVVVYNKSLSPNRVLNHANTVVY